MDFKVIDILQEDLFTIVDAALPNKAQNQAVRRQITAAVSNCMNRIAEGWLTSQEEAFGAYGRPQKSSVDQEVSILPQQIVLNKTPEPETLTTVP